MLLDFSCLCRLTLFFLIQLHKHVWYFLWVYLSYFKPNAQCCSHFFSQASGMKIVQGLIQAKNNSGYGFWVWEIHAQIRFLLTSLYWRKCLIKNDTNLILKYEGVFFLTSDVFPIKLWNSESCKHVIFQH